VLVEAFLPFIYYKFCSIAIVAAILDLEAAFYGVWLLPNSTLWKMMNKAYFSLAELQILLPSQLVTRMITLYSLEGQVTETAPFTES
jgi:hypothetical protein